MILVGGKIPSEETLYYLDAETVSEEYRVTTFSFFLEDIIRDFCSWMADRELTFSDIRYATVYRSDDFEPVADLVDDGSGGIEFCPREPDNSLLHRIVLWIRRHRR